MSSRSGAQYEIAHGRQRLVVTEVGATVRSYEVDGTPVFWGFEEDEMSTGGRGQVLAPWPNRIDAGRYDFAGLTAHAALDEPDRNNAIHGLVRWRPFRLVEAGPASLRLDLVLRPEPGYPFDLGFQVDYELVDDGLVVRSEATNLGERAAPFGLGFHDYLHAGAARVDGLEVDLGATRRLQLDARLLPVGEENVAGTPYAAVAGVHGPAPVGELRLDDCFTGLRRNGEGEWHATVRRGEDPLNEIVIWADQAFKWLMVFTGDSLPEPHRRIALAIEPMTCPPNAFNSGEGVIELKPGERFAAAWGIRLPALG